MLGPHEHSAPFYTGTLGLVLAVQVVLLVFVLASMAAAAVTDPGCLPPAPPLPDPEMRDRLPLRTVVTVHGTQVEAKLCFRCNMYRRPRSGHCSECNVCIGPWGDLNARRDHEPVLTSPPLASCLHPHDAIPDRYDHRTGWDRSTSFRALMVAGSPTPNPLV